jgi:di/tricarboxylate transporter
MQLTQILVVLVVCVPLIFVAFNRLRLDLAALIMAVSLGLMQFFGLSILGPANSPDAAQKFFSGPSQSIIIILISLFILTRGLEKSGFTRWIARWIIFKGGNRVDRLILFFASISAFLSLFMNNLAACALVMPGAIEAARQTGIKPSKLLMPVAYGTLLGGSATYFTTANILMSELLKTAVPPQAPLNILSFTPTGGLIAAAGLLFLWKFGDRLIPDREPDLHKAGAQLTGSEMEDLYQIHERLWRAKVKPGALVIGQDLSDLELGKQWGVTVAGVYDGAEKQNQPLQTGKIRAANQLLLVGNREMVSQLAALGLDIQPVDADYRLSSCGLSMAEMVLSPHSTWVGKTLKTIDFRRRFGLSVIAVQRQSRSYRTAVGDISLEPGDSILILGDRQKIAALKSSTDIVVFESNAADQPVHMKNAFISAGLLLAATAASMLGFPLAMGLFIAAILVLLFKIVSVEEAYQAIEWQAIFLISGMYAVSLAMIQTGLAGTLADWLVSLVAPAGMLGLAGGAYLLTLIITQIIGGQVAAMVVGPVVISAALHQGVNPQAVSVAAAIGCSASFLTPMAHPVNLLVSAPANYKFGDFFRVGWPLTLLSFGMLLVGLMIFW